MITKWTQHLETEDEKEAFRQEVLSAKRVLERLSDILQEDIEGINNVEMSTKIYDLPNWDFRQAHANGLKQGLNKVLILTNLDQQINKDMTNDRTNPIRQLSRPARVGSE